MNRLLVSLISAVFLGIHSAEGIEADTKKFGPLDGHAVKVFEVVDWMELSTETKSKCRKIAERSQESWREWYSENRPRVEACDERIQRLKVAGSRDELNAARAEKKKFMHTAPSLLRDPAPIQEVLTAEEGADFMARLNALKEALHGPEQQ